jgi:hypothetical protein
MLGLRGAFSVETMILIAIGIFVGLFIASRVLSRPTQETIVIIPIETIEPSPGGLGCLPLIAIGMLILLVLSSSRW